MKNGEKQDELECFAETSPRQLRPGYDSRLITEHEEFYRPQRRPVTIRPSVQVFSKCVKAD